MTFDFDAICLVSFGGPRGPEDVLPFMRNTVAGRGIPDERLIEVSGHYQRFGGISPINDRNDELLAALRAELARRGVDVPVVIGNRNWTPYLSEALSDLGEAGAKRVLCVTTAAYASYSGCRQYREDLASAMSSTELDLELTKVGPFAQTSGFITANAEALREALSQLTGTPRRVLFVTHSIPTAMDAVSGPTDEAGAHPASYSAQHEQVARAVAEEVDLADDEWEIVYCSRSGAPHMPWLEPDVNDRLEELAADGIMSVAVLPFGFINDHMEVVFDLDTQAHETADSLGMEYVRAATVGTHPAFIAGLADLILGWQPSTTGELASLPLCTPGCCQSGRPGGSPRPSLCQRSSDTPQVR